jgi:KDO2-lipid IV(A) lauroyltransferase
MYQLLYILIKLVVHLPKWLKYLLELKLFIIIYYLFGYRKQVVLDNLQLAFPDRSIRSLKKLRKQFYKHLIDVFMETIQPLAWNKQQMQDHYKLLNVELVERAAEKGSVLLLGGHYANWDWVCSIASWISKPAYVVYQPISSGHFDKLVHLIRSRFGSIMVPNGKVAKTVLSNQRKGLTAIYTMVSDQSPMLTMAKLWLPFMGVEVPVHTGAASLAVKSKMSVFYIKTHRVSKNHYEVEFEELIDDASKTDEVTLTKAYFNSLEKQIKEEPTYYFWTHKRWKHAGKKP